MNVRKRYHVVLSIFVLILLGGCTREMVLPLESTTTPDTTQTPLPTEPLMPTETPMPTNSPVPTRIPTLVWDLGSDEVLHMLEVPLADEVYTIYAVGKKMEDMDCWGIRELPVYVGTELRQTISMQEAISTDGMDGIDVGYTWCPQKENTVAVRDVNFDGYPDLEIWGWSPSNSIPYYYWCWNPETKRFDYAFCLQLTDVDEENKHLISYQKAGGGVYYTERYRVTPENRLELVERVIEDYNSLEE